MDHVPSQFEHDADGRAGRGGDVARPRWGLVVLALVLAGVFLALGVWQVERRSWKLALIARTEQRLAAAPVAAPGPADWPTLTPASAEYRRIAASGTFRHDRETFVQAVTDLGPGYWVMTPLMTRWGTLLVNRGFVPSELRDPARRPAGLVAGPVRVTGLLRMSEPGGAFLRHNDPATGRFYSRDVAAIARVRGLSTVAPYFLDADATPVPGGWPRGGLTVVRFRNAHLQYALTWFALAALSLAGAWIAARTER